MRILEYLKGKVNFKNEKKGDSTTLDDRLDIFGNIVSSDFLGSDEDAPVAGVGDSYFGTFIFFLGVVVSGYAVILAFNSSDIELYRYFHWLILLLLLVLIYGCFSNYRRSNLERLHFGEQKKEFLEELSNIDWLNRNNNQLLLSLDDFSSCDFRVVTGATPVGFLSILEEDLVDFSLWLPENHAELLDKKLFRLMHDRVGFEEFFIFDKGLLANLNALQVKNYESFNNEYIVNIKGQVIKDKVFVLFQFIKLDAKSTIFSNLENLGLAEKKKLAEKKTAFNELSIFEQQVKDAFVKDDFVQSNKKSDKMPLDEGANCLGRWLVFKRVNLVCFSDAVKDSLGLSSNTLKLAEFKKLYFKDKFVNQIDYFNYVTSRDLSISGYFTAEIKRGVILESELFKNIIFGHIDGSIKAVGGADKAAVNETSNEATSEQASKAVSISEDKFARSALGQGQVIGDVFDGFSRTSCSDRFIISNLKLFDSLGYGYLVFDEAIEGGNLVFANGRVYDLLKLNNHEFAVGRCNYSEVNQELLRKDPSIDGILDSVSEDTSKDRDGGSDGEAIIDEILYENTFIKIYGISKKNSNLKIFYFKDINGERNEKGEFIKMRELYKDAFMNMKDSGIIVRAGKIIKFNYGFMDIAENFDGLSELEVFGKLKDRNNFGDRFSVVEYIDSINSDLDDRDEGRDVSILLDKLAISISDSDYFKEKIASFTQIVAASSVPQVSFECDDLSGRKWQFSYYDLSADSKLLLISGEQVKPAASSGEVYLAESRLAGSIGHAVDFRTIFDYYLQQAKLFRGLAESKIKETSEFRYQVASISQEVIPGSSIYDKHELVNYFHGFIYEEFRLFLLYFGEDSMGGTSEEGLSNSTGNLELFSLREVADDISQRIMVSFPSLVILVGSDVSGGDFFYYGNKDFVKLYLHRIFFVISVFNLNAEWTSVNISADRDGGMVFKIIINEDFEVSYGNLLKLPTRIDDGNIYFMKFLSGVNFSLVSDEQEGVNFHELCLHFADNSRLEKLGT